ncbi:acyltransferase family protein [Desulforhopalus sp. 52FAK]
MTSVRAVQRISFIDVARFYGILLVYYGHFIESIMKKEVAIAASQYKCIYSFHMVLFFILAGYVAKDITLETKAWRFIRDRLYGRIVPYLFFGGLLIIPTFFITGNHASLDLSSWGAYKWALLATVKLGLPAFNIPTWFLLCIFAVEVIHLLIGRLFSTTLRIGAGIVIFYIAGWWFCTTFDLYNPVKGRLFSYFYFQEGLVAYSFFLLGRLLKRKDLFNSAGTFSKLQLLWAIPLGLIVLFTYDLNKGQFSFSPYDAVVILFSSHGHILWFALTATAGSLFILVLARCTKSSPLINYLGGNTLILLGLNGVFYHFVNDRLATIIAPKFSGVVELTLIGILVTAISVFLASLAIPVCNRYIPWLVGHKPGNRPTPFVTEKREYTETLEKEYVAENR